MGRLREIGRLREKIGNLRDEPRKKDSNFGIFEMENIPQYNFLCKMSSLCFYLEHESVSYLKWSVLRGTTVWI